MQFIIRKISLIPSSNPRSGSNGISQFASATAIQTLLNPVFHSQSISFISKRAKISKLGNKIPSKGKNPALLTFFYKMENWFSSVSMLFWQNKQRKQANETLVCTESLSRIQLCETLRSLARQAPLSMKPSLPPNSFHPSGAKAFHSKDRYWPKFSVQV